MGGRAEALQPGAASLPAAGFQSAAVPAEHRFEAWRESLAPSHEIGPVVDPGRETPNVVASGWALDGLVLNDLTFSPIWYRRRPEEGLVLVRFYGDGHARGALGVIEHTTSPGEIHLYDQGRSSSGACSDPQRVKSVFLPYDKLGYRPGVHPPHVSIRVDSAAGRILQSTVQGLFDTLPHAAQSEAASLAAGLSGLIHGLLLTKGSPPTDAADFHAARRQAMHRYIEAHLADPDLGIDRLCKMFAVSRATVYRDFADEGGIARFVIRRRLERAYQELAALPLGRGRVKRVAERWGFTSQYHFSRLFRQQYDRAPSDVSSETTSWPQDRLEDAPGSPRRS